jgi:hypothetical protein
LLDSPSSKEKPSSQGNPGSVGIWSRFYSDANHISCF